MDFTAEPTRTGMTFTCACGQAMACQGGLALFKGEINHYRYQCEVGHLWEDRQLSWTERGWVFLGEITALVEARELVG